jgi:hypothetical protein
MRIVKIAMLAIGIAMLVVAAIWRPVVAPSLTKLPTSLDDTIQFTGTYTGYVNQATGAALPAPQRVPLSITRTVKALPGESTSSVLVVKDASAISIGTAKSEAVLQYTLDRSTEQSVRNPDAYALVPGNVVDRAGTYSLGPPQGTDPSRSYPMWTDEIGRAVPLTSEHTATTVNGVSLQRWQYVLAATPMVPSMVTAMKLPPAMSFASFEAELKANGIDLAAAFKVLAPSLTAAQRGSLAALAEQPIPLQYVYATSAQLLIEPTTGAIADIVSDVRAYSVRPSLTHLTAVLTPILAAHQSNPVAARLIAAAGQLAGAPAQPLYTLTFQQTPASAAATAATAGHNATLLNLVRVWIPIALGVIGLILVLIAALLIFTSRRRRKAEIGSSAPEPSGAQQTAT